MPGFDEYIENIYEYIEKLREKDRLVREYYVPPHSLQPKNDVSRSGSNIVLKAETFLELGSPTMGSCAITMYTNNMKVLKDGVITLIGTDVTEATSSQLSFGQVIMVSGEKLKDEDYHKLLRYHNMTDSLEGYMIKSTKENIWSRVSNKAAENGFSFATLGAALINRIKTELPKVQSVSILFITSNKEDVIELRKIATPVREIALEIKEKIWKDRGVSIFECKPDGHCGSCKDKKVCEDIKKIGIEHKKNI